MTEEIIIFEQDGNIVGITKEGKYFESYKTTENVAILRGAGLYIKRLEQENKELKEKIIKLTEENGNLIINRNTVENKLRDTESRLISIQKSNTHNLVLLQRRNNALEEIRELSNINKEWAVFMKPIDRLEKIKKIVNEVLQ